MRTLEISGGIEENYFRLLMQTALGGDSRPSRAGPTVGRFGVTYNIDCLRHGCFPLFTTRQIFYKPVLGELAAFLQGATDLDAFQTYGCNYWDANTKNWPGTNGSKTYTGRIYGAQWRNWRTPDGEEIDQLRYLVDGLKNDPYGRRHIVTAWNPGELKDMCLPPCHDFFQCYVQAAEEEEDELGYLHMGVHMRSVDLCLGLPSDIVLYSALQLLIAKEVGLRPGALGWWLGDAHIYKNHLEPLATQLKRTPRPLPTFELAAEANLDNFEPQHLTIKDYDHAGTLKYEFNV